MFRERERTLESTCLLLDALGIGLAVGLAFLLRNVHERVPLLAWIPSTPWLSERAVRSEYWLLYVVNLVAWLGCLHNQGLYRRLPSWAAIVAGYAKGIAVSLLASGVLVFLLKISISRLFFAYFFVSVFAILFAKQVALVALLRRAGRAGRYERGALVLGELRAALQFARLLADDLPGRYQLQAVLADPPATHAQALLAPFPVHTLEQLERVLQTRRVDEVFVVGSAKHVCRLAPVAQTLIERGCVVSIVCAFRAGTEVRGRVTEFAGVPVLSYGPMPKNELREAARRAVDLVVGSAALFASTPLLALIAAAIKLTDGGPVLFRQQRLGQQGRPFTLYKFRSMRTDAEDMLRASPDLYRKYVENDFKLPANEDPRITPIGRLLRRTSLDELPQLWNVVKGDMTLVGPRPIVAEELKLYEPYGRMLLAAKPGLTGQWQVGGRSRVRYPERAFLDLDYVASNSILKDLKILARTVPAVVARRGAE